MEYHTTYGPSSTPSPYSTKLHLSASFSSRSLASCQIGILILFLLRVSALFAVVVTSGTLLRYFPSEGGEKRTSISASAAAVTKVADLYLAPFFTSTRAWIIESHSLFFLAQNETGNQNACSIAYPLIWQLMKPSVSTNGNSGMPVSCQLLQISTLNIIISLRPKL